MVATLSLAGPACNTQCVSGKRVVAFNRPHVGVRARSGALRGVWCARASGPVSAVRTWGLGQRISRVCAQMSMPVIELRRTGYGCAHSMPMRPRFCPPAVVARAAKRDPTQRIVITGMGVASVFGNDVETFYDKLLEGTSGVDLISRCVGPWMHASSRLPGGWPGSSRFGVWYSEFWKIEGSL